MQFVTYDPCITDYSDTIVSIHAGHDIIIIVNPVEVVVQGVDAKILQIVVNKQQIIDQSLIMINNEELTLINLVGNYFNKSLQNQYQGSHVLVVSNIDQVSLDNQVLICESNNVKSIDITRGSRLETLLIDGITVLRNKYYLIDDFKVPSSIQSGQLAYN
uniref:Uncharacterized protein n=1 Tax=Spironucleus salmonicida TaxID=348837 RepID=V6LZB9_9EUKA|eukprot:EST49096.1 Hypothetical protein SS50377_10630 [Spironucleus salmonicida]